MKILKRVYGAEDDARKAGTTFYAVPKSNLEQAFDKDDVNVWLKAEIEADGFDAIDFDNNLFGSKVIGDTLYICVTDGRDIIIDGKAVDPEEALDEYTPEQLSDFTSIATDKLIRRYITEYEVYTPDFDDMAVDLLRAGTSFERLADDYEEFR